MRGTTFAIALGAALLLVGAVLAFTASSAFEWLALLGALVLAGGLMIVLARAVRPAMRPQDVQYDHSWWTNLFGGTSTPHPGPATRRSEDDAPNTSRPEKPTDG